MTKLPTELWIEIIQHVYYQSNGLIDYPTLGACALVHSSWLEPARRLLFHTINVNKSHTLDQLTHGQILSSYVRRLQVWITVPRSSDAALDPTSFALTILRCPSLYELTINSFGFHHWDEEELSHLRAVASVVPIRALRMPRFGVQSPIVYQLISVWPSIQFLTIGAEIGVAPPTDLAMPQLKLKELVLGRSRIPSEYLQWFLSESKTTMEILELRDVFGQGLRDIMIEHGPYIRSLRIMHFNKGAAEILQLCTRLEELVLYHVPIVFPLEKLPVTIEHFSIRNAANAAIDIASAIVTPIKSLSALRVVTIDEHIEHSPGIFALRQFCNERGAELRVHTFDYRIVSTTP